MGSMEIWQSWLRFWEEKIKGHVEPSKKFYYDFICSFPIGLTFPFLSLGMYHERSKTDPLFFFADDVMDVNQLDISFLWLLESNTFSRAVLFSFFLTQEKKSKFKELHKIIIKPLYLIIFLSTIPIGRLIAFYQ